MSFRTELRAELVSAAEREHARRLPRVDVPVRGMLLTTAAAALVTLVVVVAVGSLATTPRDDAPVASEPAPDVRPLFGGSLEPGVRYETRAFVPTLSFVVADERWSVNDTSRPDALLLEHGEPFFDPATNERRPAGGLAFSYLIEDLYAHLRAHPDLRVGPAEPVTVAGVPGQRFDVAVRFEKPARPAPACRTMQLSCTLLTPDVYVQNGMLLQMTVLQTEPEPLVITLDHHTRAGLRKMEKVAAPVLDSLRIGVR